MKAKHLIFPIFCTVLAAPAWAQGSLKFAQETHEFGTVAEGRTVAYDFEFTNTGNAPVVISNVTASCGCTTPFWTHEPVLPGKKGKISASYNSAGRPGPFTKTITVASNAANTSLVLTIKGTVTPKPTATPEELALSPTLTLQAAGHAFGRIERNKPVSKTFTFTNTGKTALSVKGVYSPCGCVTHKVSKPSVKPGEQATLELRYTPRALNQQNERVTVTTNDLNTPTHNILLQANVVESLTQPSLLREQKPAVPF